MRRISREELRALLDAGAVTGVEALPEEPYEAEHILGAVNLPGDLTGQSTDRLAGAT